MESALLEESFQPGLVTKQKTNCPITYKALGTIIDGVHCDIFISNYRDKVLIIISQFKKIGALVLVNKDEVQFNITGSVYHTRSLLGSDSDEIHVSARYLFEHLGINKPAVFGISLKNYSLKTLVLLKEILLQNKLWLA